MKEAITMKLSICGCEMNFALGGTVKLWLQRCDKRVLGVQESSRDTEGGPFRQVNSH